MECVDSGEQVSSAAAFKRRQLEKLRRAKQEAAPSVLERFNAEVLRPDASEPEPDGKPGKCPNCGGSGQVAGLLKAYDCYLCEGTGYDLSDPVVVIKFLQAGGRKLKKMYKSLASEHRFFRGLWSAEEIKERQQMASDRFISEHHSSRFD